MLEPVSGEQAFNPMTTASTRLIMPGWRMASTGIGIASPGATLSTLLGVGAELAAPNNSSSTGGITRQRRAGHRKLLIRQNEE